MKQLFIFTVLCLLCLQAQTFGQIIFEDDFETGTFKPEWTATPGASGGLIQVVSSIGSITNAAHSGIYAVAMGKSSDGAFTTNTLDLQLDLSTYTEVAMTFWIYDYADETNPEDGIYMSDDGGATFVKVYSFRPQDWNSAYGKLPPLDIDQLASNNGLNLTNQFVIRFQQRDNGDFFTSGDEDGFLIDDIEVYVPTKTYATLPFSDGFESGSLGASWEFADAFRKGNTGAETSILPGGIVEVRSSIGSITNTARTGTQAVALGRRNTDGNATVNALDLHLDLSGETEVEMSFWIYDYADETQPEDGIYMSDDGGATFIKVYSFRPQDWNTAYGKLPPLDIDQLASNNGLNLTNQFVIRFQQRDGADFFTSGDEDGFLIDDIEVYVPTKTYATLPFSDGFESGSLGASWEFADAFRKGNTGGETNILPGGMVEVRSSIGNIANTARTGTQAVALGRRNTDGNATVNALDLHLDLSGETEVEMSFWIYDYADETNPGDGIYMSDDGGATFIKVYSFRPQDWNTAYGKLPPLDIDQLALSNGLNLTNQFVIRFQQRDGADFFTSGDNDGFLIDDVEVYVPATTYATLPFSDNFDTGTLGNNWTHADPFRKGNTEAETTILTGGMVEVRSAMGDYTNPTPRVVLGRRNTDGNLTTNALDLHLDLAGQTQVEMSFGIWGDIDETNPTEGIYFSDNGGVSFTKVYNFRTGDWANNFGKLPPLDIDELATSNGLTLTNQFIIRFQQQDNADFFLAGDEDGWVIDDVEVYVPMLTYATLPFTDGFESGDLGDSWTFADAFRKGNTGAENSILPGGAVRVESSIGNITSTARTGTEAVILGRPTIAGNFTTNALDLHLDLSGETQVELNFWMNDYNDETHPEDGVYMSDNGGVSFTKIYSFNPASVTGYQLYTLDIDGLASSNSLTLSNQVIIRFQQYDDADFFLSGDEDGFLIDDVEVINPVKPYITDFTPGSGPEGVQVTIQGGNFQNHGAIDVFFNGTAVPATDLTVVSDALAIAKVPTGATTGKISITNPEGTGFSTSDFVITSELVLDPINLVATAGNGQVNLSWVNQATNATEIIIERSEGTASNFQNLVTLPDGVDTYVDISVVNGTTYYYRVRAFSLLGSSNYSNTDNATPSAITPPTAPSGLVITAPTSATPRLELSWTDNSSNEEGFEVWRALTSTGTFTKIITVPTDITTYTDIDASLAFSTEYCYRIVAFNAGGSNESNTACQTTQSSPTVPNAPSALTANAPSTSSDTQIDLIWQDNSSDEEGFRILRSTSATGTFDEVAVLASDVSNYSDIGLSFATEYFYRVVAFNTVGDSPESNTASATSQGKVTSLEDLQSLGVKAYPNPTSDILFLASEKWIGKDIKLVIHNTQGKQVFKQSFENIRNRISIDVQDYPNGLYLLHLMLENEELVYRFIKE